MNADRDRIEDLSAALPREPATGLASAPRLAQTVVAAAYPTIAASWYGMTTLTASGSEAEGAGAAFTAVTDDRFLALNIGGKVPPMGTKIVCTPVDGSFIFRYDG